MLEEDESISGPPVLMRRGLTSATPVTPDQGRGAYHPTTRFGPARRWCCLRVFQSARLLLPAEKRGRGGRWAEGRMGGRGVVAGECGAGALLCRQLAVWASARKSVAPGSRMRGTVRTAARTCMMSMTSLDVRLCCGVVPIVGHRMGGRGAAGSMVDGMVRVCSVSVLWALGDENW